MWLFWFNFPENEYFQNQFQCQYTFSQGRIFWHFKKSKNQKQGREIKGKERGNENEEEQKKEKKVNYKFPSTY